jgi:hypothetical protein
VARNLGDGLAGEPRADPDRTGRTAQGKESTPTEVQRFQSEQAEIAARDQRGNYTVIIW